MFDCIYKVDSDLLENHQVLTTFPLWNCALPVSLEKPCIHVSGLAQGPLHPASVCLPFSLSSLIASL